MDGVLFEAWLESIRLLTGRQRQAGFACLALAEADDDWDSISLELRQCTNLVGLW